MDSSLSQFQFVEQVFAAAEFVEDEEDETHIDVDAALELRVELEVAAEAFDVSVKGKTDEFALVVQYCRA